ncbi:MAG: CopG family transcriptional regulator [Candidatus Andersenbacteria bacterium]
MKRTQIYLPEHIHRRLKIEAKRRKCSMADVVRESVEKDLSNPKKYKGADVMMDMLADAERLEKDYPTPPDAPTDLAENHDYYLYGKGRIE